VRVQVAVKFDRQMAVTAHLATNPPQRERPVLQSGA
jgi:hypothetical protein